MPIYTFRCTRCEHVFEELQTISATPPPCPYEIAGPGGGTEPCAAPTVKVPSAVSRPLGGDTPIHFRNRRENR